MLSDTEIKKIIEFLTVIFFLFYLKSTENILSKPVFVIYFSYCVFELLKLFSSDKPGEMSSDKGGKWIEIREIDSSSSSNSLANTFKVIEINDDDDDEDDKKEITRKIENKKDRIEKNPAGANTHMQTTRTGFIRAHPKATEPFWFFDTTLGAFSKEDLMNAFNTGGKERVKFMKIPKDIEEDVSKLTIDRYQEVPQDHWAWKYVRSLRVESRKKGEFLDSISASELGNLLDMHYPEYELNPVISQYMYTKKNTVNTKWEKIFKSSMYGSYPTEEFAHRNSIWARWGNNHENNLIHVFLQEHQNAVYRDQGFTLLTKEKIKEAGGLTNMLTGEPIESLPFILGASPDGLIDFIDEKTGRPLETCNCEWKCVAVAFPKHNTPLECSSFFENKAIKPYPHVKQYYVQQAMLQMLVCGTKKNYWACWSLRNGMNVWTIHYDKDYMSMIITLLLHVYTALKKFANERKSTNSNNNSQSSSSSFSHKETKTFPPEIMNGYYYSLPDKHPVKVLHEKFIRLTDKMVSLKTDLIKKYAVYPDTFARATQMTGITDKGDVPYRGNAFPEYPIETPSYTILAHFARFLEAPDSVEKFTWHKDNYNDSVARISNLGVVSSHYLLRFAKPVYDLYLQRKNFNSFVKNDQFVINSSLSKAENYLIPFAALVYRLEERFQIQLAYATRELEEIKTADFYAYLHQLQTLHVNPIDKNKTLPAFSIQNIKSWVHSCKPMLEEYIKTPLKHDIVKEGRDIPIEMHIKGFISEIPTFGDFSKKSEIIRAVVAIVGTCITCKKYIEGDF